MLLTNKPTVAVFTLGCKTNSYESGQIVAALQERGYNAREGLAAADIFVLNTCAVTAEAERKSRQAVARARKLNPACKIVVTGCAAQKNAARFADFDNVTLVTGNSKKAVLSEIIENKGVFTEPVETKYFDYSFAAPSKTRAYIKIQDGCDNFCSYCIVPYLRGRSRSRDIASIVKEIEASAAREFVLLGIDISQYGRDIGTNLPALLTALFHIKARIRLSSLYQNVVTKELLAAMKANVCRHLHLSLQSGSDKVLAAMGRRYTTEEYYQTVRLVREYYPDCGITTDIIAGYPAETDADFEDTLRFVERADFSDIHVFPYSPREGTKAFALGSLDAGLVKERAQRLTDIKHRLKDAFIEKNLGTAAEVLVEEKKAGFWTGYTGNYIKVYIEGKAKHGELVNVKLAEKFLEGAKGI